MTGKTLKEVGPAEDVVIRYREGHDCPPCLAEKFGDDELIRLKYTHSENGPEACTSCGGSRPKIAVPVPTPPGMAGNVYEA